MPSDKTKRLIALDSDYYHDILKSSLCKDGVKLCITLRTTRQQSFNAKLKEISDKYKETPAGIKISFCKCSEPLPSTPYALPKDHKPGILKGRPIISTTYSAVRKLSIFFASY